MKERAVAQQDAEQEERTRICLPGKSRPGQAAWTSDGGVGISRWDTQVGPDHQDRREGRRPELNCLERRTRQCPRPSSPRTHLLSFSRNGRPPPATRAPPPLVSAERLPYTIRTPRPRSPAHTNFNHFNSFNFLNHFCSPKPRRRTSTSSTSSTSSTRLMPMTPPAGPKPDPFCTERTGRSA